MKTLILLTLVWSMNVSAAGESITDSLECAKEIKCDGVEVTWDSENGFSAKKDGAEVINPNKAICTLRKACNKMDFEDGIAILPIEGLNMVQSQACNSTWMTAKANDAIYKSKWNCILPDATDRYY